MTQDRRKFIKASASMAGLLMMQQMAGNLMSFASEVNAKRAKGFGLQLYTLREDMPKDPKGVLKQVSDAGYRLIESYEHGTLGMFWGMSPADYKSYLDSLGMTMVSSHCNINTDFERKAAAAASIGMKYLICPYLGPQKSLDDYKRFADQFNACGEICKKNGIRFAYHNHDYSFKLKDGQYPQDVMMKGTDASLVDFEMDMYWVVTAGEDPIAWMKKYPKRFTLCHVKDRTKNAKETSDSCTLGTGMIDYATIARRASKAGMKYFIVEQEKYAGTTPLESMANNAKYMKALKF